MAPSRLQEVEYRPPKAFVANEISVRRNSILSSCVGLPDRLHIYQPITLSNHKRIIFTDPPISMSSNRSDNDNALSQKCRRLEDLLHQALTLASAIAEDQAPPDSALSAGHIRGEDTTQLKASTPDPAGANQHQARHIFPGTQNDEAVDPKDKRGDTQTSPPPASTVQEPFSPGTLALSLDAMVEGDTPDGGDCASSCCLDNSGPSSSSSTTKKSSLSSIEESLEPGGLVSLSALLKAPASSRERSPEQQRQITPPSKVLASIQTTAPATPHQDTHTGAWDLTADASPSPTESRMSHDEIAAGEEPSLPPSDV